LGSIFQCKQQKIKGFSKSFHDQNCHPDAGGIFLLSNYKVYYKLLSLNEGRSLLRRDDNFGREKLTQTPDLKHTTPKS
jgi:hypothetical protein